MRASIPYGFLSDASLSGYLNYTPSGRVAFAMVGVDTVALFYIHADVLGSFDVITDATGAVVERNSFDPWGRRRNPADWSYNNVPATPLLTGRGFTGHEHLTWFGLINMNARLYDPIVGRFLSPDPYVQDLGNTQSYNRYLYCLNNPLIYTDPTGEIAWFVPVIIGAIVGTYTGGVIANEGQYNPGKWDPAKRPQAGALCLPCFRPRPLRAESGPRTVSLLSQYK